MENGGCGRSITLHLCCSSLITLFPCSSVESLPRDTVLQKLCQPGCPMRCSPSGTDCSTVGHSSCQKTYSCMDSSRQAGGPARSLLQHGPPTGCSFLQGISTAAAWGPPRIGVCIYASPWWSMDSRGHPASVWSLHKPQGNLCSSTWSLSSRSFTDLNVCRVVSFICFFNHLSQLLCSIFYPFLNVIIQKCHRLG